MADIENADPGPSTGERPVDAGDLVIRRQLKASRIAVWGAWSDPERLARWWCPRPWTTEVRAFDLRPGGAFHTFLRGPDGGTSDNPGCFLLVEPLQRVVWTTMLTGDWQPASPWMPITAIVTLRDGLGGQGTDYEVRVRHLDEATREKHLQMGFEQGWNACIDQLDEEAGGR